MESRQSLRPNASSRERERLTRGLSAAIFRIVPSSKASLVVDSPIRAVAGHPNQVSRSTSSPSQKREEKRKTRTLNVVDDLPQTLELLTVVVEPLEELLVLGQLVSSVSRNETLSINQIQRKVSSARHSPAFSRMEEQTFVSTSQNFLTASSSETPFRVKNEMSCLATPTAADPAPKKTVKPQKRRRVSTYEGPTERITQKDGSPIFWSPSALPLASALF